MLNSYGKPMLPFHNPTSKAPVLAECGPAWTCRVREQRPRSGSWGERDLGWRHGG